jgi:hypothetical protein
MWLIERWRIVYPGTEKGVGESGKWIVKWKRGRSKPGHAGGVIPLVLEIFQMLVRLSLTYLPPNLQVRYFGAY